MKRLLAKIRRQRLWKRIIFWVSSGIFFLLVLIVATAEFTSRPKFCSTCHYMEPFYQSWQASEHHDVTCTKCHFEPGLAGTVRGKLEGLVQIANYLSRSYTRRKPWADISDASCLTSGCHEGQLLSDSVRFKGVVFGHSAHLTKISDGKQLKCTSCHAQIVQGNHIIVSEETCFLCHFKKSPETGALFNAPLANCQGCHQRDTTLAVTNEFNHNEVVRKQVACERCHSRTIVGDGFVPPETCEHCHFEQKKIEIYSQPDSLHKIHITEHKVECRQCHTRIQHKLNKVSSVDELTCTNCHSDTHREQVTLFTGAVPDTLKNTVNPMYEAGLDCASCHVFHGTTLGESQVNRAKPASCENCHGKGYAHLLELWQKTATTKLRKYARDIRRVADALPPGSPSAKAMVDEARRSLHIIEVGKTVHNVRYSDELIRRGYETLNMALESARLSWRLPKYQTSQNVPGNCASCHTGVDALDTKFNGEPFSHGKHVAVQQLACSTCHSNERRHGELVVERETCNACHHREEKNCESCHKEEQALFSGTYLGSDAPDSMFDEELGCIDCHDSNGKIVLPNATICLDCHDEGYDETARDWKTTTTQSIAQIRSLLRERKASDRDSLQAEIAPILDTIERSGGQGAHNYDLIEELLDKAKSRLLNPNTEE